VTSGPEGGGGGGQQQPRLHDEVLEFGRPRRIGRRWLSRLVLAALVIAAAVVVFYHPPKQHAAPPQLVSVTNVGHPILGVRAGWQLFGLTTTNSVVSVEFGRGQITRTVLPQAEGNGPVSFIVGPHDAIVRPLDNVPGYVIRDGLPPRPLTGILAHGGLLLPGPSASDEWLVSNDAITLVGPAGQATAVHLALPVQHWPLGTAMADGRGEVLMFNDAGVLYDTSPRLVRRIGVLLAAIGPRIWLGLNCERTSCHNMAIDTMTDARRMLPGPPLDIVSWPWPAAPGVVAPDGSVAAVTAAYGASGVALDLVNLSTGVVTTAPAPIAQDSSSRTLAWSPDSRWLFVITANGGLVAVNPRDGTVHSLGARLPGLSQIAMRGTSG
jgi:hypothetical protein